jgi:hypothetical protein
MDTQILLAFIPNVHAVNPSLNPEVNMSPKIFCHIDETLKLKALAERK